MVREALDSAVPPPRKAVTRTAPVLGPYRVNVASRWLSPDNATVALSFRHKRNDIFWFTLMHEMCHILRHSKKHTFVHTMDDDNGAELEQEADAFAARLPIPPHVAGALES